jgi:hypothetical protein
MVMYAYTSDRKNPFRVEIEDELPRHVDFRSNNPSTTMIQLKVHPTNHFHFHFLILTSSNPTNHPPSQTLLNCIDNSGASVVECVNVLKKKRAATIGQSTSSHPQSLPKTPVTNRFETAIPILTLHR